MDDLRAIRGSASTRNIIILDLRGRQKPCSDVSATLKVEDLLNKTGFVPSQWDRVCGSIEFVASS